MAPDWLILLASCVFVLAAIVNVLVLFRLLTRVSVLETRLEDLLRYIKPLLHRLVTGT